MDNIHEDGKNGVVNPQEAVAKLADQVGPTAAQVSAEAARTAAEARRSIRESAYTVKETAANSLLTAAENIRREAAKSGSDDAVRQAHQISRGMEKTAVYLDSHTFEQIGDDAVEVIKDNPWETVGVAFLVGLIIGMILNRGRRV